MTDSRDSREREEDELETEAASGRSEPRFDEDSHRDDDLAVVQNRVADRFDYIETIQRAPSDSAWECLFHGTETVYSIEKTDPESDESPQFGVFTGAYSADLGYERADFLGWFDEAAEAVEFLNDHR